MTIPTDEEIQKACSCVDEYRVLDFTGNRMLWRKGAEWCRGKMLPEIEGLQKLVIECQDRIKQLEDRREEESLKDETD